MKQSLQISEPYFIMRNFFSERWIEKHIKLYFKHIVCGDKKNKSIVVIQPLQIGSVLMLFDL